MGTWGRGGGEKRTKERAGWNKGDETVGVCNCSGFNALLMADGTRDWGNGLHQMSLLARGEEEREERDAEKSIRRDAQRASETRGVSSFSPPPILCARSFPHRLHGVRCRLLFPASFYLGILQSFGD